MILTIRKFLYQIKIRLLILYISFKKFFLFRNYVVDEKTHDLLTSLEKNGFVVHRDSENIELADTILNDYFIKNNPMIFNNSNRNLIHEISSSANQIGNFQAFASFFDKNIQKILCSNLICNVIEIYAGTAMFYRENPILELHRFENPAEATRDIQPYAVSFHSDYFRQINVMLLLTDINENDTCTEYALGSNNRNAFFQGVAQKYPNTNKIIERSGYQIKKITGKKGDIVLMDTTGIHRVRVMPNSNRKMLIGIANPNHPFLGYKENISENDFLKQLDPNLNSKLIKFS